MPWKNDAGRRRSSPPSLGRDGRIADHDARRLATPDGGRDTGHAWHLRQRAERRLARLMRAVQPDLNRPLIAADRLREIDTAHAMAVSAVAKHLFQPGHDLSRGRRELPGPRGIAGEMRPRTQEAEPGARRMQTCAEAVAVLG